MRKSYIEEPSGESKGGGSRGSISSDLSYKLWPESKQREDVEERKERGKTKNQQMRVQLLQKNAFYAEASQSHTGES